MFAIIHKNPALCAAVILGFFGSVPVSGADKPTKAEEHEQWVRGFLQERARDLIFVKSKEGKGSGFLCSFRGKDVLVTNIHVVAGMENPQYVRLSGGPVQVGLAAAAVGHDVMCFGVSPIEKPLEVMEQIDKEVGVGDDILVIGNTEGADVALPLSGKVVAIGPNLMEISAEIQSGNSGSPIIHKKTGKIIAIATHLLRKPQIPDDEDKSGKTKSKGKEKQDTRRFGTRLDTIREWNRVEWTQFKREAMQYNRICSQTHELANLLFGMKDQGVAALLESKNPSLQDAGMRYMRMLKNRQSTRYDFILASENLVNEMKGTCRSDVWNARNSFQIDFFRSRAEEEIPFRQEMATIFEQIAAGITSMKGQ